jgi:CubicO group peptidase (beta-lactamase class C family)
MTKPVTAVAVLMMQDEGKLSIDDPLAKYLPDFADSGVTLRHMLTHTSGMGEATELELAEAKTLADLVPVYAKKPLGFKPGSQWLYCQAGINMLGRVVEITSGLRLEEFFSRRLFQPLGMKDTTFYLSQSQLNRWVKPVRRQGDQFVEASITILAGKLPTRKDRFPAANGGLFSTGPDYAKFARMLLRGGELGGKRYLSTESFRQLTTMQTGDLEAGFIPGYAWGLGVGIVKEPQGPTALVKPGTFGHGGAYGTQAWIDLQSGVATVLMINRAGFPNADDTDVHLGFRQAALSQP